jgi:hypothetical protein
MSKFHSLRIAGVAILLVAALITGAYAQKKEPVIFKAPEGFFPVEFSNHVGKLLLNPKSPAGMFVAYPSEGQDIDGFIKEMQNTVAKMFLRDAKDLKWETAPLPPHKGIDESGNIFTTSDDKMEVQLAFYVRPEGVAYGYYGMRHKKGGGEDAKFLKGDGAGVKAFDELAKSILNKSRQ